jgi:hypothetical protein
MDGCFQGSRAAARQGTGVPGLALSYRTLASFSRLILLDRRAPASPIRSRPIRFRPGSPNQELALILDEVGSPAGGAAGDAGCRPYGAVLCRHRPERTSARLLAHATAK